MDPLMRLAVVLGLVMAVSALTVAYRRRRRADEQVGASRADGAAWPLWPSELRTPGPEASWAIFTTPVCASCDAVAADLREAFPDMSVTKVDATVRPDVAEAYAVRRAPTTVLVDDAGRVVERLVGPEQVRDYVRGISRSS
jgi:hypothetical protein